MKKKKVIGWKYDEIEKKWREIYDKQELTDTNSKS